MKSAAAKVVLLGPDAMRFRGGIAQFTSRLALELAQTSELSFFSWKELYPRVFISRKNLNRSAQKKAPYPSKALLSYSRPWSWKKTATAIAATKPEKIFLTWSHPVHAPVFLALVRMLRSRSDAEIVAICHNVLPHEQFPFAEKAAKKFFTSVDRVIVHSQAEASRLHALNAKIRSTSLFIPNFDLFAPVESQSVRSNPRILFFGNIRPYKGLDTLLLAMPELLQRRPDLKLTVAGEPFYRSGSPLLRLLQSSKNSDPLRQIERLNIDDSVEVELGYIPDGEVPHLFANTDLVVYPFHSCTGSASLSLAFALGKPVVTTTVGDLAEIVQPGINGLLVSPGDSRGLAQAIDSLLDRLPTQNQVLASTSRYSWSRYCEGALEQTSEARKYA